VVVVPGKGGKNEIFWTGAQAGFSEVVCRGVEQILIRGRSTLPLPEGEQELLDEFIGTCPSLHPGTIHIHEKPGKGGPEVGILTFRGRKFNRILAALLRTAAARKVTVTYHDFSLTLKKVAKEQAGRVTHDMLESLRTANPRDIAHVLTIPGTETWKFAGALPDSLLKDMALTDTFRFPEFIQEFADLNLVIIPPEEYQKIR
jgi:hypothetical protein